jgi:hypothetical protein
LFEQRRLKNFFLALKGCGLAACLRFKAESLCVPVLELPALDYLLIALASKLSYSAPAQMGRYAPQLNGFFMNIFSNNDASVTFPA